MALIQLWMHLMFCHSAAAADGKLVGSARRTWNVLRVAVLVVCTMYTIGFAVLLAYYFNASALCSVQIASASVSDACITDSGDSEPSGCIALVDIVRAIKYFEGVFSGTVAVVFTLYALTFNGLVYAVLTGAKGHSKLQHAVVGNKALRLLLNP
jgi:hypothetical protein